MQKYALEDGTLLVGRDALVNTMKDLIFDAVGALVVSVIGYISLKHKKGWLDSLLIRKKKTRTEAQDSGEAIEAGADAADETAKAARSDRKSSGEAAYAGKDPQNGIGIGQ